VTVDSAHESGGPSSGPDWETYARAERFLPWNADKLVFGASIEPHWIDDTETFWYRVTRPNGAEFMLVDAESGTRKPAFDHVQLAASLTKVSGTPFEAAKLPFDEIELEGDGSVVRFTIDGVGWSCDVASYVCTKGEKLREEPSDTVRSPDSKWEAFVRDHNLLVRSVEDGTERALTRDGACEYGFGAALVSPLASAGLADPENPAVLWSPDSTKLLSCRIDERNALRFHLVQSIPPNGGIRPVLHTYAYPLPGDEDVPLAEMWCFDVAEGTNVKGDLGPLPMLYYGSPLNPNIVWWQDDASQVFVLVRDRGYLSYRLLAIDTATGSSREVIKEVAETGIDPYLLWAAVGVRVLGDGSQVIWYSQRHGWANLYLYDASTGNLIRQLTTGPGNVAEIAHVDEAGRQVYFTAVGREPDRDPYFTHLYQVSLDGGEPQLITPEDAEHSVIFSPSGRFYVDTFSRLDLPPITTLRAADGKEVIELERADVETLLGTGWQFPERFTAKSRDGVTDVYGVIFRPTSFDLNGKYPILDNIYGGPQVNQAPTSFADSKPFGGAHRAGRGRGFWHAQALAELGFVVVMIDGLGMPARSKAFHDVSYGNLGDGGIEDHIAGLRQLGDRYPNFDLSRVGIYGHSAGGYASVHAILTYPDFYKVCVSSAGNHDHRLDKATWVERYMGLPVEDHYRAQANQSLAAGLKGKLLLIHGEMDENVHPASTMVLVDALIKENKDFDLLIMPNFPHFCDGDPYFVRRRWDYFVRHLIGSVPPEGYRIAPRAD
jgi:dipeptidyl-peptidase 4